MANYKPKIIMSQKSTLSHYAIFYPSTDNFLQPVIDEIDKLNISIDNAHAIESEIKTAEALIKLTHELKVPYINFSKLN